MELFTIGLKNNNNNKQNNNNNSNIVIITNINDIEKKISEDFFKYGDKSWDELIVVIPGKMDDNESLESHEKKDKK